MLFQVALLLFVVDVWWKCATNTSCGTLGFNHQTWERGIALVLPAVALSDVTALPGHRFAHAQRVICNTRVGRRRLYRACPVGTWKVHLHLHSTYLPWTSQTNLVSPCPDMQWLPRISRARGHWPYLPRDFLFGCSKSRYRPKVSTHSRRRPRSLPASSSTMLSVPGVRRRLSTKAIRTIRYFKVE